MSIDWSATGDMLSGIGTIGGAVAVLIVAILGSDALTNFRAQKMAERQMEHAEEILATSYRLKSALDQIRSPFSSSTELEKSKADLEKGDVLNGMPAARAEKFVQANVYYIRSNNFSEEFSKAYDLLPYAAAYFGQEVKNSLEMLIQNRHRIRVFADAYARDRGSDNVLDKQVSAALWKGYAIDTEDDQITKTTDAAVENLEGVLIPIIRLPSDLKNKKTLREK